MSNELAVQQSHGLQNFSQEDVILIRDTVCKGATETEFKLFINQARATGLNPLARQVFAVKRWDNNLGREAMSIQVSIDGFRLIAERTGKYSGQTPPQWCGMDGIWQDVWLESSPPSAARVGVLRHDFTEPCYGVARFNAYAQTKKDGTLTMMWKKMGDVMIAKCAESLALRKAFPQELSGLYTSDEMAQSSVGDEQQPSLIGKPNATELSPDEQILADGATAYANEIALCDTDEKLELVVKRNLTLMAKLVTALPRYHARIVHLLDERRKVFVSEDQETPISSILAAG